LSLALPLRSDVYNWNGLLTGAQGGTSDVWNTNTANWFGFGTTWPAVSTGDDDAVFGELSGSVILTNAVTANDITFSQTNNSAYTIGADGTAGVITLDGTSPTINSSGNASLNNIGAAITGSTGLVKTGIRTLQLRGTNTYAGPTRVQSGTLLIGLGNNRLPTGTLLILGDADSNTSGVFQMNSRSQQVGGIESAGTGTGNRVINGSATATTFTISNANDHTFGGVLGGASANDNNFNVTKTGVSRLILTSNNTFSGTATISGGTLELGHPTNTLGNSTPVNVNGGILDIADKTDAVGVLTITSGSITGTIGELYAPICTGKAGTVTAILTGPTNLSGTTNIWLVKDTAGTLVLAGSNTFRGNINVTAGRLTLANSQAVGTRNGTDRKGLLSQGTSRSVWLRGGITLPDYLDIFASSNSGDGGGINNETNDNQITGPIYVSTGNPVLNISSAADTLTISGDVALTTSSRPLNLGGASTNDNIITGSVRESTNAGVGVMAVVKQGTGKWILSGTNTYSSNTVVNGGTLVLASGGSTKFYPKSDGSCNRITGNGSTIIMDGAFLIALTNAVTATNGTSWLLVDVANVNESFGTNFTVNALDETNVTVSAFTEAPAGTWKLTSGSNTYTFTTIDGILTKAAVSGSPFEDWMSANFPELTSPDNLPGADPDGDGVGNFNEFALAGDPTDGANDGLTRFGIESVSGTNHLTFTFASRTGAVFSGTAPAVGSKDGVDYTVRASTDLTGYSLGVEEVTPAITTGLPTVPSGFEYRTFRVTDPTTSHPSAFIQVKTDPSAP
jgi:autotransporter-associated beta strand protein